MANRITTWSDGDILYAASLNGEFDNIYTGSIDRTAGRYGSADGIPLTFGSSQDASLQYSSVQTNDALVLGLGTDSRSFIICDEGDKAVNWGYAVATDPTLFIHSASATPAEVASYTYNRIFLNETSDANCTVGITINQGATTDSNMLSFKAAAVAHGITTDVETDTYATFAIRDTSYGGLEIIGYSEATICVDLSGTSIASDQNRNTTATAPIFFSPSKKSGTTHTDWDLGDNLVVIRNHDKSQFFFDAAGVVETIGMDLGDGAAGPGVKVGSNTNASNTGAGWVCLTNKTGTAYYLWVDSTGDLRINTAAPTHANDVSGTVVGAQS